MVSLTKAQILFIQLHPHHCISSQRSCVHTPGFPLSPLHRLLHLILFVKLPERHHSLQVSSDHDNLTSSSKVSWTLVGRTRRQSSKPLYTQCYEVTYQHNLDKGQRFLGDRVQIFWSYPKSLESESKCWQYPGGSDMTTKIDKFKIDINRS